MNGEDVGNFARKQMMRAHYDMVIATMRAACEKSIQILELVRANEACTCNPQAPEFMCLTCTAILQGFVKAGDKLTNIVEVDEPANLELSGAPDTPTHYAENCLCDSCAAKRTELTKLPEGQSGIVVGYDLRDPDWQELFTDEE